MKSTSSMLLNFPQHIQERGENITFPAGTTVFQEGDKPDYVYVLKSGHCMLSRDAEPLGEAQSDTMLDEIAVLGGLPHTIRAIAMSQCIFMRWKIDDLWHDEAFSKSAREYLAHQLQQSQAKLEQLQAPVHYQPYTSQVMAGPYVFPNCTIIFAFCSAPKMAFSLPDGVSRVGEGLLLGIADFQNAYYDHKPDARFTYTETTVFVPVRVGAKLGLYVPYIFPSAPEPIVIGREIYGFPKQFGETRFSDSQVSVSIAGEDTFHFSWNKQEQTNEARIVGAFGQLFGVQGHLTAAAFTIGDTLLGLINVPFYRRVNVFNHKRIPAIDTTKDNPAYDVDMLTQAIFSVEQWQSIKHLPQSHLSVTGSLFKTWDITLRDAFYTQLTMRLSTGRKVRDYLSE